MNTRQLFWSRIPGNFVNRENGVNPYESTQGVGGPSFSGRVVDWYDTLNEVILHAADILFVKTLQPANIIEVNSAILTILEHTTLFTPLKKNELPKTPQPTWLKGVPRGRIRNMLIVQNDELPKAELRVSVVSSIKPTYKSKTPKNSPEIMDVGGKLVPAPIIPEIDIEDLKDPQMLDSFTITVLNACVD